MDFQTLWAQLGWRSVLDILLVATLCYQIISMLKGTRAAQVLIGMLVIFLGYALSSLFELETIHWIIGKFYSSLIIVVIVLFQDDLRRLLTRVGRGPFSSGLESQSGIRVIQEVINATSMLSHDRIGALIVFERAVGLDKLHDHSLRIEGNVTEQLLVCIFQSFSPLHDGAVIIQKNKISCASAQLPLSKNPRFSKRLGTRHSAAVGISEETDAVVLVVSEETGNISIACDGQIQKQQTVEHAHKRLASLLLPRRKQPFLARWVEWKIISPLTKYTLGIRRRFNKKLQWDGQERRHMSATYVLQGGGQTARVAGSSLTTSGPLEPTLSLKLGLGRDQDLPSYGSSFLSYSSFPTSMVPDPMDSQLPHMPEKMLTENILNLKPEDRFIPPEPPSPPPRDVEIGGVPLNPPLALANDDQKKKVNHGNKDDQEDK